MDPTVERAQMPAFEDGLGRRYTVDAGGEAHEVLTVRQELASSPSFEFAVRERTTRLEGFLRACYGHVRSVERINGESPTLAVVSERIEGARLSHVLAVAEHHNIPFEIDAALCLIRQLVQAISLLHEHAPDVAHGAIAPERLIVTPHARLVVVDYVFGAALRDLNWSREQYWKDLRVAIAASAGAPRLDRRSDVTQVGAVALSAVLGRLLRDEDYPARVGDVLAGAEAVTANGREPLSSGLRVWISRALQVEPRDPFASAIEAGTALEGVLGESDYTAAPAALQTFLKKCQTAEREHGPINYAKFVAPTAKSAPASSPAPAPAAPATAAIPAPPVPAPSSLLKQADVAATAASAPAAEAKKPEPKPQRDEPLFDRVQVTPMAQELPSLGGIFATEEEEDDEVPAMPQRQPRSGWSPTWLIGAAVALIVVTSGVTLLTFQFFRTPAAETGMLNVSTSRPGVEVVIDGQTRGKTPLETELAPGDYIVELVTESDRRRIPVTIAAGSNVSQFVEMAATENVGKVSVRTEPAGARVSVDGNFFGMSPITVEGLAPGVHTVKVGDEGASVTEKVTIEAGATASLVVPLATARAASASAGGWIAVTVPAEVQIYANQNLIGTSRSTRIMVPAGRHQLEIVNDALGYRYQQSVLVNPGAVAAVKPAWPRGTVALNALPWAEVRIDGERVGDTPIGSVMLPIGQHEVVFRHPELGEQRQQITVTLKGPTRLSVDMRKK
jgi:hypothetical protein